MSATYIPPLPGAKISVRVAAFIRTWRAKRLLNRLLGIETVVIQGHVFTVTPQPIRVCRQLVPALIRCSRRFAEWQLDESAIDDLVQVISLGLNAPAAKIESLIVSIWDLAPLVEMIARVNGLPVAEAGRADLGELLAALTKSTGTNSVPSSSAQPAGPGHTSTMR